MKKKLKVPDKKIKISVVNYTNSLPFVYGLENYKGVMNFELQKDIPSECARKLIDNEVDIGLIPVAVIPLLKEVHILTNYCIGAVGEVSSVLLLSEVPLEKIETNSISGPFKFMHADHLS